MGDRDELNNPDLLFEKALEALKNEHLHDALTFLKRAFALGLHPVHTTLLNDLSAKFQAMELWREAEDSLLEWLRVNPESEEAHNALSHLHSDPERFYDVRSAVDSQNLEIIAQRTVISKVPPIQLIIELTNSCNGRCITCLNSSMKRSRGVMDFELFKKIVDESLKCLYLEAVHLYGIGEDYLIPNVMDYFDYAISRYYEAGVRTVLITNGERVTYLPDRISTVDISFNAGTPKSYWEITGMDFHRTVSNIYRLERDGNLGPHVNLHMLVFKRNVHEVEEFKKLFAFTSANLVLAFKYDNQCGALEDETLDRFRSYTKIPCHYVRNVMNVCWNGDVTLCCHDSDAQVVHGNVKNLSLEQIWYGRSHSEKVVKHGKLMFDGLCRHCNFNIPIVDQNVTVTKEERIALRKQHLDYALEHMVACPQAKSCDFVNRYRQRLEEIERFSTPLIRICSDDPRFYGIEAVLNTSSGSNCPHLRRIKEKFKAARVTWEGSIFGPSGYAFAARNYVIGLADLGASVRSQPVWHDCSMKVLDRSTDGG